MANHLTPTEHLFPQRHHLGHRPAVTNQLEQLGGNQRDRFGVIEPQPAGQALLSERASGVQQQLVLLSRGKTHRVELSLAPIKVAK